MCKSYNAQHALWACDMSTNRNGQETVIKKYKKLVKPNDAWVKGHVKLKILTKANHPKPT